MAPSTKSHGHKKATKNRGSKKAATRAQTLKKNTAQGALVHRVLETGGKGFIRRTAMRTAYGEEWPKLATPAEKKAAKDWVSSGGAAGPLVINRRTFTVDQWRAFHDQYLLSKSRKTKQLRAAAREKEGKEWPKTHSVTDQVFIERAAEVAKFVEAYEAAGTVSDEDA